MQRTIFFLFFALPLFVSAQNERSLSPYFIVNVDSGESIPDFPLHSTSADVTISGVIADVTVTQVYMNRSSRALEAIYVFPGSTNAAVYAMEMQVGRRTIEAKIMERGAARQGYEKAKQEGKTTSLLEQERPNIFTMNVANVMPGDSIIVRMSYTERLVPTEGVYEFVYPTVVAPRYTGGGAPIASLDNNTGLPTGEIPYTKKGVKPAYDFDIDVSVASGIPFEFIRSTSHKVLLSFESTKSANVLLDKSESTGGDRDYILQYRFAGGKIETGLMLYEGKDENYFMLMMEPPKRVPLDSIPPREYIFIMDVSGSMYGYPLETSKKLLRNLVGGLRLTDKFNVIQFAGGGAQFKPESVNATAINVDSAIAFIGHAQAGGGTELNNATRMAMFMPEQKGYCRSIVIVTDGMISAEASVLQSMRTHLDSANVFAFGIGSSCNRYLIEAMAFCGNGEPSIVTKDTEADSAAEAFRRYISSPVLSDIKISYEGFDAYDVDPVAVPDLFASRPLIITGKYRGKSTGKITVNGMTGAGAYHKEISVDSVKSSKKNKAIRLLWARDRIKYLSYLDSPGNQYYYRPTSNSSIQKEILELGLRYSLLTNYTSFLAVDKRVRNENPEADTTAPQPLPLPAGVDNSAVGMTGTLNQVNIVSVGGVVDACYASVCSISRCEIGSSRPVFPAAQVALQDPATAGDFNRYYNGGFILPVMSNNAQPFFTAGVSGRMCNLMNIDMIGSYSLGAYGLDGSALTSPFNTGSFGFNSWVPDRNILNVSATHYSTQNLYYANQSKIREGLRSIFEISEQCKGVNTDRNKDGYEDLNTGTNLSIHHRLSYTYNSKTLYYSRTLQNDIYIHSSWLKGGQFAESVYTTHDNTFGFFMSPRAILSVGNGNYFDLKGSVAVASLDQGWGVDRFHSNTTQFTFGTNYDWSDMTFSYNAGLDGWISTGQERWNLSRFSAEHQSAGAHIDARFNKEQWRINGLMRAEYNDVGGFAVLPSLRVTHDLTENIYVSVGGYRYRDVPFAIGQLQSLFYSTRALEVDSNPGLNQGWDFKANISIDKLFHRAIFLGITYDAILPEHSVIVDVDSDASKTSVYGLDGSPLTHRLMTNLHSIISSRIEVDANYVMTYVPYKFGETLYQQPLLPFHRGFASLTWKNGSENIHARMQICYTGTQRIPQAGWSDDFVTLNLEAKYKFRNGRFTVFANAFNLLDYRQKQVVTTTNEHIDGWKVWAPITGRTFQAGVSMRF
jgi:Ca-activated chloride channel family protein